MLYSFLRILAECSVADQADMLGGDNLQPGTEVLGNRDRQASVVGVGFKSFAFPLFRQVNRYASIGRR